MPAPTGIDEIRALTAYQELMQTAAIGAPPLLALVGAGLSAPAGLPTWKALRKHLVAELQTLASQQDDTKDATKLATEAYQIANHESYWVSFERLERTLGKMTYTSEIRRQLAAAETASIPEIYRLLWQTPIRGIFTVNLDSFARRSFSEVNQGDELKSFTGLEASRLMRVLHTRHKFVINLHGNTDDSESWVFTDRDLKKLLYSTNYQNMLASTFSSHSVLFLGISADDIAVGGPLQALAARRVEGPTHFWITDRNSPDARAWAESAGVRIIPYDSTNGHAVLREILNDLNSAVAAEPPAPPVVSAASPGSDAGLPPSDELVARPLEEIRTLLNSHARKILARPDGEFEYKKFAEEYDESIHRAWYTTDKGKNTLFGNTLHEAVARGAFGRVYRASDPDDNPIAVKVLLSEIRTDTELQMSFRRGVQAMRILERRGIQGMVAYKDASEIPAFVTMEWIDGPNLSEAKKLSLLDDWTDILWVANELVRVIGTAHALPERVLHRDIRPANVMLRNGWLDASEWEVVVLDFDLSTFRGARQKSVLAEGSALGFLAPEQMDDSKFSTRSAAVDSFGLGMTLFFLCGGVEPEAYMHRHADYEAQVRRAARTPRETSWRSLPVRIGRLILGATVDNQVQRWDVSQIRHELERLQSAHRDPAKVRAADMLVDEIAARSPALANSVTWNADRESVSMQSPTGLSLELAGPVESETIDLRISWASLGTEDRSRLGKYLAERSNRAAGSLRSGGWDKVSLESERQSFVLTARVSVNSAATRLDNIASSLDTAVGQLSFADV